MGGTISGQGHSGVLISPTPISLYSEVFLSVSLAVYLVSVSVYT